jgi:hypothetical protein
VIASDDGVQLPFTSGRLACRGLNFDPVLNTSAVAAAAFNKNAEAAPLFERIIKGTFAWNRRGTVPRLDCSAGRESVGEPRAGDLESNRMQGADGTFELLLPYSDGFQLDNLSQTHGLLPKGCDRRA